MKKKLFALTPLVLILAASAVYLSKRAPRSPYKFELPEGWQTFTPSPTEACEPNNPKMGMHVVADLDGDQKPDEAFILQNKETNAVAVFVYLSSTGHLERAKDFEVYSQIYLDILKPGEAVTACGKGYFDCTGEPEVLKMENPTLDVIYCEKTDFALVWNKDTKKFAEVWLSD